MGHPITLGSLRSRVCLGFPGWSPGAGWGTDGSLPRVRELGAAEVSLAAKPTKGPPSSTLGLVNHQGFGGGANIIMTQQESYRLKGKAVQKHPKEREGQGCQVIPSLHRPIIGTGPEQPWSPWCLWSRW